MKPVHAEWAAANGWVIPTPHRWPVRAFIAAQFLANLHHIRRLAGEPTHHQGRYG